MTHAAIQADGRTRTQTPRGSLQTPRRHSSPPPFLPPAPASKHTWASPFRPPAQARPASPLPTRQLPTGRRTRGYRTLNATPTRPSSPCSLPRPQGQDHLARRSALNPGGRRPRVQRTEAVAARSGLPWAPVFPWDVELPVAVLVQAGRVSQTEKEFRFYTQSLDHSQEKRRNWQGVPSREN